MDLNSPQSSDNEAEKQPDDACVILEVKQPVKRRKPKKIAQFKKRKGKPPSSLRAVPTTKAECTPMGASKRKRYDSESEEAVSDTESEDDAAGKEGRMQRRTIRRIRNCITDPKELKRFDALPCKEKVFYRPTRARTQTAIMNITSHKSPVGRTPGKFYDKTHEKTVDEAVVSSHDDTDDDYKEPIDEPPPAVVVPPKKRKLSAESLPCNKRRSSLDAILSKVSVPISPPAPPVTPPAPPTTTPAVPPATPPLKSAPAVAVASWRQRREQAPQPAIEAVALGRPVHAGKVGMLNVRPAPPQPRQAPPQPPPQPPQPASKVGTLVYYDAWALKGFPDHPLAEKALAEYDRDEFVRKNTTVEPVRVEPVLGALPRSLTEYVREPPQPPPAAHLQPAAPPAWPALEWKRVPATPRTPQRYWNRGGSALAGPSQPPRSPPRARHDPRFEPRFGPDSDRRRCFDWRFDRDRRW